MPRRKKIRLDASVYQVEGRMVSITTCTANRSPVFEDLEFGCFCIEELRRLSRQTGVRVFGFCLMPDHAHLLLNINGQTGIVDFMRAWKSKCYQLRRARGHRERLWQRSFHDHVLRSDEDVRAVCEYIVGNPVRAGLASDAREYPLGGSFEFDLW